MPLPPNFNNWAHLRSVLMTTHNRLVREKFSDVGPEDWSPSITTPRSSLRHACTIQATDSVLVANTRMSLFYDLLGQGANQEPWMGLPMHEAAVRMSGRPMITLVFYEDTQDVDPGYQPVSGNISFRLRDETPQSVTDSDLRAIALKIRSTFGTGLGYVWRKGKAIASYQDSKNGYRLQLLCRNAADARSLVADVLALQEVTPDWAKLNFKENQEPSTAFPTIPKTQTILGKTLREARRRPISEVRFRYAWALVPGYPAPITLVDLTGTRQNALVAS